MVQGSWKLILTTSFSECQLVHTNMGTSTVCLVRFKCRKRGHSCLLMRTNKVKNCIPCSFIHNKPQLRFWKFWSHFIPYPFDYNSNECLVICLIELIILCDSYLEELIYKELNSSISCNYSFVWEEWLAMESQCPPHTSWDVGSIPCKVRCSFCLRWNNNSDLYIWPYLN